MATQRRCEGLLGADPVPPVSHGIHNTQVTVQSSSLQSVGEHAEIRPGVPQLGVCIFFRRVGVAFCGPFFFKGNQGEIPPFLCGPQNLETNPWLLPGSFSCAAVGSIALTFDMFAQW